MITVQTSRLSPARSTDHEYEWKVWRDVKLHATNLVEHPEVVADCIVRFAEGLW